MMEEQLLFAYERSSFFLRAIGHITASFCPSIKDNLQAILQENPNLEAVYIDLSQCDYMDSTFMGLLLILQKILKERSGRKLTILDPSEESLHLLDTLGISKVTEIRRNAPVEFPSEMRAAQREAAPSAEFLLRAHQNLMELSDENRNKFAAAEKLLQEEIKRKG